MQFSLRSLLVFVTLVAVALSLARWLYELGIAIALLAGGIGLIAVGVWSKRKRYTIAGCVSIAILVVSSPWVLVEVCWVGHRQISVTVRVQDDLGNPIQDAEVQLADMQVGTASTAVTDSSGVSAVVGEFMVGGRDSLFRRNGGISLSFSHQLAVKARGFTAFQRRLPETVGRSWWDLYALTPPEVVVTLKRDGPLANPK